jgi:hypothetical protein
LFQTTQRLLVILADLTGPATSIASLVVSSGEVSLSRFLVIEAIVELRGGHRTEPLGVLAVSLTVWANNPSTLRFGGAVAVFAFFSGIAAVFVIIHDNSLFAK